MTMNTVRLWPNVQALGRTIVCNRSDIFQQGYRAYNNQNTTHLNPTINCSSFNQNFEKETKFRQKLLHTGRGSYVKVISQKFSSCIHLLCREFTDGENEYAHDILCSLPAYKATTVDMKQSINYMNSISMLHFNDKYWPAVGTTDLVNQFSCLSKASSLSKVSLDDHVYHNLIIALIERIPFMSDEQLLVVLSSLTYWSTTSTLNNSGKFDILWKALDNCCSKRMDKWDVCKVFLVADHWYALRMSKLSIFFAKLIHNLGINIRKMNPTQFVQFMFYANLNREFGSICKVHLEKKIEESLKYISIEELGIIAMALFKTQTSIENWELIQHIIKITKENFGEISDHSLGSILKLLNRSLPSFSQLQCYDFLESLVPFLDKFNNFVMMQVAIFGNNLLVFHKEAMTKVCSRFGNEIPNLRLKDIERFTYSLMLYKFIPPDYPNILSLIIEELRKPERVVEINHFPRSFSSCVSYLTAMEVFPHDLISAALQPSMIKLLNLNTKEEIGREVNELNWSLKIEVPAYLGFSLNPYESHQLTKRFIGRIPVAGSKNLTHQEKLLLDVKVKISALIGKEDCVEPIIILPHFSNPDLVFCTTLEGEPVEIPNIYKHLPFEALKSLQDFKNSALMWNAVIIGGRNSYIRETKHLRGNMEMKKRQLRKLGYRVSVIPYVGYVKTSLKYKLLLLEKCLTESTLCLEGRRDMAFTILKQLHSTDISKSEPHTLENVVQGQKV